jgi:hypothetical protein
VSLKTFTVITVSLFAVLALLCFTQLSIFNVLGFAMLGAFFAIPFALFRLLWRAGTKLGGRK